jgi:glycosyltransferase involved in cell wall biosynthesis
VNKKPLVSVLMPVFNGANYIGQSIESIINQKYDNWELIIVNDASTDNTLEVIKTYKDQRIKVFSNKEKLGLAGNRNKAISHAKGELIAVLDADDLSLPDRFDLQTRAFANDNNLVLCGTWAEVIDQNGNIKAKWKFPSDSRLLKAQFYIQFPIVHSSAMFKAQTLMSLGQFYDSKFSPAEDYELCFRILDKGNIAVIPKVQTRYRVHSTNTSRNYLHTVNEILPSLYNREFNKIGVTLSTEELVDIAAFLNPTATANKSIIMTFSNILKLRSAIVRKYNLTQAHLLHWNIYIYKTLIYQIKNKITSL